MSKNRKGFFTDNLSEEEVFFSKNVAECIEKSKWGKKLIQDRKISRALKIRPDPSREYDELNQIKSAFFEVRFAYSLLLMKFPVEYEAKLGIGNSSVDFKVKDGNNTWLIELTSLRESDAVKNATFTCKDDIIQYSSVDEGKCNSANVRDLIRLQEAIYGKVTKKNNNKIESLKFPAVTKNTYHAVIVDARSFNAGMFDCGDFLIAVYGSHQLEHIEDGVFCRFFIDKEGNSSHIQGVFEDNNNKIESKIVCEKIHFICFTVEHEYKENELIEKMLVFANPKYFQDEERAKEVWLFNKHLCFLVVKNKKSI